MRELNHSTLPVMSDGDLRGIVTQENVGELLMMREAQAESASRGRTRQSPDGAPKYCLAVDAATVRTPRNHRGDVCIKKSACR